MLLTDASSCIFCAQVLQLYFWIDLCTGMLQPIQELPAGNIEVRHREKWCCDVGGLVAGIVLVDII